MSEKGFRQWGNEEVTRRGRDAYWFDPPTWPHHCFSINRSQFAANDTDRWRGLCRGSRRCEADSAYWWGKVNFGAKWYTPWAEPLRQISKCWSIQSARNQEIRWKCLYRSRRFYTHYVKGEFYMFKRCNLSMIKVSQLFLDIYLSLSVLHCIKIISHFLVYIAYDDVKR